MCDYLQNNSIDDKKYLELMIPHHQAAVDMSKIIYETSNNDVISNFARNVILNQTSEINRMKALLRDILLSINETNSNRPVINDIKFYYPSIFDNLKCDASHFNFNQHIHKMNENEYIKHMLSHHNTALLLSELIIKSTKNSKIFILAQTIYLDQSREMFLLYFLEKSLKYTS